MLKLHATVLIGVCLLGCAERVETTLDGVNISVNGPTGPLNVVDDTAQVQVGTDKYALAVQDGRLTVNGNDYGAVNEGDSVEISSGGIKINGKLPVAAKK